MPRKTSAYKNRIIAVRLTADEFAKVEAYAKEHGLSLSEILRKALWELIS